VTGRTSLFCYVLVLDHDAHEHHVSLACFFVIIPSEMMKLWRLPWILTFLSLFGVPWIWFAIVDRYWVRRDWNEVLVGSDESVWTKFTILAHMTLGAISMMMLGPLQFVFCPTPSS
jgi:hypothetical protein